MQQDRLVIGTRRYSSWSLRGWLAVQLAGLKVTVELVPLQGSGQTAALKGNTPTGLVPYLEHGGARVWESLAICEYCADIEPALWPVERAARAHARSAAAEMHAGFLAMRRVMPMNLGRNFEGVIHDADTEADIARIDGLWREALATFGRGGPFLYGTEFGLADAMFAPVVTRFLTYRPELSPQASAYCQAVRAHKLMVQWYDDAAAEPAAWRLAKYESLQL
jgi:glutathione S-transferase